MNVKLFCFGLAFFAISDSNQANDMKHIVVFGAGKSATVLISYLLAHAAADDFRLTVVDANLELAKSKTGDSPHGNALSFDIQDAAIRGNLIGRADVVISLLPPSLHILVARDCVSFCKHLITASYIDAAMLELKDEIEQNGLLFLCEMGLDPGIDHMSAMQIIHRIEAGGGIIHSFHSHCGGLVAPESDDNPWHYKISWNPRNVVLAGKAGALYKENGKEVSLSYENLFNPEKKVQVPGLGELAYYPNRDSLSYIPVYGLKAAHTFIRTTLRYPDFCFGWKHVVELQLTDEEKVYQTDGLSLAGFFKQHFAKMNFSAWLDRHLSERFADARRAMELAQAEAMDNDELFLVDQDGELREMQHAREELAHTAASKMREANLVLKQLIFLGMDSAEQINLGLCSAADVMQFILEKKLALLPDDKDMIVMLHEIGFTERGHDRQVRSCLIVKGDDALHTAMAKTVGLPPGIAARLLLKGELQLRGLRIPTVPELYELVLPELEKNGIVFHEEII